MTIAAIALLAFVIGLLAFDLATMGQRGRRAVLLEAIAFAVGGFFIAFPDTSTRLAHTVGIGRGVDFLLYPIVIWLVRESLMTRRRRLEYDERLAQVVRALAVLQAKRVDAAPDSQT